MARWSFGTARQSHKEDAGGVPFLVAYLDFIRFFAAFLVVLGHARLHAFGQGLRLREVSDNAGEMFIGLMSSQAHRAVILFFVVSGYLVGGKLINAYSADGDFMRRYAIDRASRIYTVSIPATIFSASLVLILTLTYGQSYSLTHDNCTIDFADFLSTTFFLHEGFIASNACNGPFWSLDYEVFYYVWFAVLALAVLGTRKETRIAAAIVFVLVAIYGFMEPRS